MSATNQHPSATTFGQVEREFEPLLGLASTALSSGESTIPRQMVTGVVANPTGFLHLTYFTARKSEACSNVRMVTSSTAAAATPTLCRIGIYSADASGNVTLVASIVNDTTLFAAANTPYTRALTAPFPKVKGQRYALGVLVVSGAAVPSFAGITPFNASVNTEMGQAPVLCHRLASQTDLPASVAIGSLSAAYNLMYGVVLP